MRRPVTVVVALALAGSVTPAAAPAATGGAETRPSFDLQGHRGARGLRPENTLPAFGKALQIGVTTLELDTGVTQDGVVVVSHERRIASLECVDTAPAVAGDPEFPYVGKLIRDLTLRQLKTLDCGTRRPADPATDPFVGTQESVPGTRMPTLKEVFDLADRYGASRVRFNIETKIDPTVDETVGPKRFARSVLDVIRRDGKLRRSSVQSFDWRTLAHLTKIEPRLRTVALAEARTAQIGQPGRSPWLAGYDVDSDRFGGDIAKAAKALGADELSPNYGAGTWGTPSFVPFMTLAMIESAHRLGLEVVPWTVNDPRALREALTYPIDGIITDYPDRARVAMAERGIRLPRAYESPFEVHGHRGARTYRPENTLPAFTYALEHGADVLELDTGVTQDGVLVVIHDRRVNSTHCADTAPAVPGDPEYPYGGKLIRDLTLAQLRTLDCGRTDPGFPMQVAQPGAKLPTLQEVFDLVKAAGREDVGFNIETKISPTVDDTVPYRRFTELLVDAIEDNDLEDRAVIQSFDWRTIIYAKQLNRRIDTSALVWQFAGTDCDDISDECSLQAVVGDPTVTSPWTGGLDWWDYRDLGRLVRAAKADIVSANWQVHDPHQGRVDSPDYYLKEHPAIYHGPSVARLQARGIKVIPYTINDAPTMQRVIDLGVDGIISDDVDLLVLVAKRNGLD